MAGGSEFLGQQDRDHEVEEEADSDQPEDECFHVSEGAGAQRTLPQKWA
jgi:hypothetical protein